MRGLGLHLMGPVGATVDDRPFDGLHSRPALALIIYLACHPERHRRESLIELLWPEFQPESAHQNLRQTLYTLRQSLPEVASATGPGDCLVPLILADRESVQLNPDALVEVDARQFAALLDGSGQDPRRMEAAVALYRGDFLSDFYLPDSGPFEAWAAARRADLRRLMLDALDGLAIHAEQHGRHAESAAYARRQLEIDNLRESASRQLMLALAMSGQRSEALAHFKHCERLLQDELGVEPAAETRALAERISRDQLGRETERPAGGFERPRSNLPSYPSSFIGREREIVEGRNSVAAARLVTLTGPGGCGKTRLAVEVARSLQSAFPDGVWLVEFAALTDPALVSQTVAETLGLREMSDRPIQDVLVDYLRERTALLVLDNCEHLIDACAGLVDEVLRACPPLHILATSRQPLRIIGEVARPVPPLALAAEGPLPDLAELDEVESIRLFVDRASTVRAEFQLTGKNAAAVASVCRHLDGMPLAIELAAARVGVLSPEEIDRRLADSIRLLTLGSRTALPRQQTLRATIDWSYALLSEPEQRLFRRLAVFRGGWTLEAAEAICSDDDLAKDEIFDLLSELADKSLINAKERAGAMRYSSLETIRQYGTEKLLESGEGQRVRRRHLEYFLDFVERGDREFRGPQSLTWARKIELEYSNIRAALEHAFSSEEENNTGLKLTIALAGGPGHGYWHRRSQFNEAHFWVEKALDCDIAQAGTANRAALLFHYSVSMNNRPHWPEVRPLLEESLTTFSSLGESYSTHRAYVLVWLGFKLCYHEEFRTGTRYLEEALAIFEKSGDKWGQGHALNFLCGTRYDMEMDADAWPLAEQGLAVARECGEPFLLAIFLDNIGWFMVGQGQNDVGKAYLEEALAKYQDFESKGFALQDLRILGDLARRMNECDQAEMYYRDSQRMAQEIGWQSYGADLSMLLGLIRLNEGKLADATTCFVEALNVCRQCGHQLGLVACLDCLAAQRTVQTKFSEAARLFGAFDAQIESWLAKGFTKRRLFDGIDLLEHDRYLSSCRAQLDATTFEARFAEGRAMALEEALAYGMAEAEAAVALSSRP